MKLIIVAVAVLLLCGLSMADVAPPPPNECAQKLCTQDYKPVCGEENGKQMTFGNPCVLDLHNCEKKAKFTKVGDGECANKAPVRLA